MNNNQIKRLVKYGNPEERIERNNRVGKLTLDRATEEGAKAAILVIITTYIYSHTGEVDATALHEYLLGAITGIFGFVSGGEMYFALTAILKSIKLDLENQKIKAEIQRLEPKHL